MDATDPLTVATVGVRQSRCRRVMLPKLNQNGYGA
jgi:hypothetical protein